MKNNEKNQATNLENYKTELKKSISIIEIQQEELHEINNSIINKVKEKAKYCKEDCTPCSLSHVCND